MALNLSITPSFRTFPPFPSNPKPKSSSAASPHHSTLHLFRSSNSLISLSPSATTPSAISQSPDPIFLPFLQEQEEEEERQQKQQEQERQQREKQLQEQQKQEEIDLEEDPIIKFFKTRSVTPTEDPEYEGRTLLQKNRRSSWRLADIKSIETDAEEEEYEEAEENELLLDSGVPNSSPVEGIVEEILQLARNVPENSTLGELLGSSYVGKIGESECVEILSLMGDEGLVISSLYFFEWMGSQEPSLVSPKACNVMFRVLGSAGMGEKLMILFNNLPADKQFRDLRVYNSAISGLSCCRRYDDAWKVYEEMEMANIQPDHVTCSILITVMRKSGRSAKDAWEFFERMNGKGVKWSLEVLGALIKSFCDEGLKKEALIIQSDMEKKGISSNAIIYNTLMDAYAKDYQIEEAEGLFMEMKEKGIKPTSASYNILMDAYSRRMQPEIIEDLLLEMREVGLEPNVKSYTCLISAYGRQKKMSDRAADAFLRMKKVGIKPTSHSYTALIHAYSVDGWHVKAYSAFENMMREGIKPAVETYTALLDAFRRAGDTETLMQVWKLMGSDRVEGTRVTFNILLDGFAKQGKYIEARDVVSEFGKIGHQPTVMTYNMLMNAYARGGQHSKLPQLLKEMAALNLKPDSVTYSTMIYAYVRVRDFRRAFYYHKQMVKSKQVPDARSYQKLRAILDVKAATKNRKDKSAILGIINSKMGLLKPKRGKKDEFWKNRKR
ncbi:Pentatricopeptide repeat [Macleaya cordata]|uniref:Pentatricopeptide repeat n=1 Tax=Macleaya cordata TaxID=56857 RepID=A0A200RCT7_MACCD|nr:Pentatricopeptide repeat [Macleaya cordata]